MLKKHLLHIFIFSGLSFGGLDIFTESDDNSSFGAVFAQLHAVFAQLHSTVKLMTSCLFFSIISFSILEPQPSVTKR